MARSSDIKWARDRGCFVFTPHTPASKAVAEAVAAARLHFALPPEAACVRSGEAENECATAEDEFAAAEDFVDELFGRTLVVKLTAIPQGAGDLAVTCTSLGGERLCTEIIARTEPMCELYTAILGTVGCLACTVRLVLPDGTLLNERRCIGVEVGALLLGETAGSELAAGSSPAVLGDRPPLPAIASEPIAQFAELDVVGYGGETENCPLLLSGPVGPEPSALLPTPPQGDVGPEPPVEAGPPGSSAQLPLGCWLPPCIRAPDPAALGPPPAAKQPVGQEVHVPDSLQYTVPGPPCRLWRPPNVQFAELDVGYGADAENSPLLLREPVGPEPPAESGPGQHPEPRLAELVRRHGRPSE